MELISIIVPVYKAEKYLYNCIESILNQTYSNIECILVDDGSPDHCPQICDEYAKKDKRIKVIHKTNGGQSSARNKGLEIAEGKYIGFVDSDDWIHPQMIEILYKTIKHTRAGCAACDFYRITNKEKMNTIDYSGIDINRDIIPNISGLDCNTIFSDYHDTYFYKIQPAVWNKLCKKSIFDDLRFEEGVIYEDEFILAPLILNAEKVAIIDTKLYYYNQLSVSTMRSEFSEKRYSALDLHKEECRFFNGKSKNEYNKFLKGYCETFICMSIITNIYKKEYKHDFAKYKKEMLKLIPKVMHNEMMCNMLKLTFLIAFINCRLCEKLCVKYFGEIISHIQYTLNP